MANREELLSDLLEALKQHFESEGMSVEDGSTTGHISLVFQMDTALEALPLTTVPPV